MLAALVAASGAFAVERIGTRGDDVLDGTGRADVLHGDQGDDLLRGRRGRDRLVGGRGYDTLRGGRGADVLDARRADEDRVDCGPGEDVAIVDATEDGVLDCEQVRFPGASR